MIATGRKTIEVRSWFTHHRGWVIVHAGRQMDEPCSKRYPLGVTVCVVEIIDCVAYVHKRHGEQAMQGRRPLPLAPHYAWILGRVERVRQIGLTGQQGLFDAPSGLIGQLGIDIVRLQKG